MKRVADFLFTKAGNEVNGGTVEQRTIKNAHPASVIQWRAEEPLFICTGTEVSFSRFGGIEYLTSLNRNNLWRTCGTRSLEIACYRFRRCELNSCKSLSLQIRP